MGLVETTEVILTCTGDFMPGSNDRVKNEEYANLFPACSIEAANLANNHAADFGQEASDTTIAAWAKLPLAAIPAWTKRCR